MILTNQTRQTALASELKIADNFFSRLKGLMFDSNLPAGHGLKIENCKSIHTCFMNFPIDAVFVDEKLQVKKCFHQLPAWRMTFPVFNASAVIELPSGTLLKTQTQIGDQLNVGA